MSELRILGMAGTSQPFRRLPRLIVWATARASATASMQAVSVGAGVLIARRALPMILGNQLVQAFAAECGGRVVRQGSVEETLRQRVFSRRPAGKQIELALGGDDAPCCLTEFVAG